MASRENSVIIPEQCRFRRPFGPARLPFFAGGLSITLRLICKYRAGKKKATLI
jgi:hypothetical protein